MRVIVFLMIKNYLQELAILTILEFKSKPKDQLV
jgi:hypothetical protein